MRWGWVVLAAVAGACPESNTAARGLRVPLPPGWAANAGSAGGLAVGPKGRAVLTLERRAASLPPEAVLKAAVEAEGGVVERASSTPGSTLVRYLKGSGGGLLMARTLERSALLLCATLPGAEQEDLVAAEALCAGVRLEP